MIVTFEQLPSAVNQIFEKLEKIESLLAAKSSQEDFSQDKLLTVQDAAEFLSVTVPTVYSLIAKGQIPVMKRSKRCYFSKNELLQYLRQGRVQTVGEAAKEAENFIKSKKR